LGLPLLKCPFLLRRTLYLAVVVYALCAPGRAQDSLYNLTPDAFPHQGVPEGRVEGPLIHQDKIYPGISREYWIYVPQQYAASKPAALTVFLDGYQYLRDDYMVRARHVLDNLIQEKEIPVMIAIFVNPGHLEGGKSPDNASWETTNRATEYIATNDRFSRLLIEELLPEVAARYNITEDPAGHCIVGASQGGAGAFIAAWSRPDYFEKVITHVGSFVNGPNIYPEEIRALATAKPIRISMQENAGDNRHDENPDGDWVIQNLRLYLALREKHYDVQLVWGQGIHSLVYGGVVLPDQMRWIWRDYQTSQ
jgi:enterochelin esterase-like enzyme